MWFSYSIISILAWGTADLFYKMGTDPKDELSHWRVVIMVGLVMGVHASLTLINGGTGFELADILVYAPVSLMYILSMALGYAGLRYIELSVSSPVCNSSGAVAAVLCFIFLGHAIEGLQIFAVAIISVGLIVLAALEQRYELFERTEDEKSSKFRYGAMAMVFPVLYCLIDGIGTTLDAYYLESVIDETRANIAYEYTFLIAAAVGYIYVRIIKKRRFKLLDEKIFALAAICETAGQFTYIRAMAAKPIIAAPLVASYSIVSMLLSRIFLKEKLKLAQYLAIAAVMAGIIILGME